VGAYDSTLGGYQDVFVSVIDPAGGGSSDLLYSTYFGSSTHDDVWLDCIAVSGGRVYLTGWTNQDAADFPITPSAWDTSLNGSKDVFVSVIDPAGGGSSDLLYSTFLGGSESDTNTAIAVAGGKVYVSGTTSWRKNIPMDLPFPTTTGAYDRSLGNGLIPREYSTFLGGTGPDGGRGIAVSRGDVYVSGDSFDNFPTTPGAFDTDNENDNDAFVAVLRPAVSGAAGLLYSTLLGGDGGDATKAMAFSGGDVYLTGLTSLNFPTTPGAFDATGNGFRDAFVAVVRPFPGVLFEDGFESGDTTAWTNTLP
jgi:hypothetical protein